jgi:2-polyprenyl-6-methoxyphenol hydroxylase-like FAD-dependent oxidoreductase
MRNASVLISGLGIAGATLAYWLAEQGFHPTLVERSPRPRTTGYVIDFWGRGYDIAERMGIIPDLKLEGYDVKELRLVDAYGRRVGGFEAQVFRALTDDRYLTIPRSELANALLRKISGRHEIIFGDTIFSIEQSGEGVLVTFGNHKPRRYDLVVGADGLHSMVRKLAFGGAQVSETFLGYMAAAFEVEGYRPRDERTYVSFAAPGKQIARFALRNDRTAFLFVFAADGVSPFATNIRTHKSILHAQFDDAGWECRRILEFLDKSDELYFDRVSQIKIDRWTRGRVALVGDAAFCPSLLAGQGAALAMVAAYVLAGELGKSHARPEIGMQRYEEILRPFITEKQTAATKLATSFAPRTRVGLILRNQITRAFAIPWVAKLMLNRLIADRIYLPTYPTRLQKVLVDINDYVR